MNQTLNPIGIPAALRRYRIDLHTLAESAITSAVQAVEAAGADPRLTEASILLLQAREKVSDHVDGVTRDPSTSTAGTQRSEVNPNPHEAERRIALEAGDIDDMDILVGLYATKCERAVWSRMRALLTTKTGE